MAEENNTTWCTDLKDNVYYQEYENLYMGEKVIDEEFRENFTEEEFDNSMEYITEKEKIKAFFQKSCGCTLGQGGVSCSDIINKEAVEHLRGCLQEIVSAEKDIAILSFFVMNHPIFSFKRKRSPYSTFRLFDNVVCKKMFVCL